MSADTDGGEMRVAGHGAIADVGQTLVEVLRNRLRDPPGVISTDEEVALASPGSVGSSDDVRLTLYLYRIVPNGELNNAERIDMVDGGTKQPPLALDLHYLLTSHPSTVRTDETGRTVDQHRVLGRAIQVLHDNAVISGSDLKSSLVGEGVHITIRPESMDEMTSLWSTFPETPYLPSVSYLITPIFIESAREADVPRVLERGSRSRTRGVQDEE